MIMIAKIEPAASNAYRRKLSDFLTEINKKSHYISIIHYFITTLKHKINGNIDTNEDIADFTILPK